MAAKNQNIAAREAVKVGEGEMKAGGGWQM